MNEHHEHEHKLHLTIVFNDVPKEKDFPPHEKVEQVIRDSLPPGEKQNWEKYQISDRMHALDPKKSLAENGVKDGDTLFITKKEGGGGFN